MDLALAIGLFILLIIAPAFWRSRKNPKRRLAEKIILLALVVWVFFALRAFMK